MRYLGVEIEERHLALVELKTAGDSYEVPHAARLPLPEEASPRDMAVTLANYLGDHGLSGVRLALSLPASQCALKFARLPRARGAEQERLARYEAASQIPLPLNEMVWDYHIAAPSFTPLSHTLIAATRRAPVDALLEAFADEGLRPRIIDVSLLAAVRALADAGDARDPYLLVVVGETWADIALVEDEEVYASRSLRAGLRELAQAIAGDGKISYEDAVENLETRGICDEPALGGGIAEVDAWFDRLGQHIRQTADSLAADGAERRPRRVVLLGGIGLSSGCAEALSRRCGLPVEIGDPWVEMRVDAQCRQTARERPAAFAAATGLALAGLHRAGGINFLPRLRAEATLRARKHAVVLTGLSLAVVALLAICQVTHTARVNTQDAVRELKAKVTALREEARGQAARPAADIGEMRATVQAAGEPRQQPLELLRRFSAELPRGVVLTEFSYQHDKAVMLKGSAVSNATIADAVAILNAMGTFTNIRLDFVNARKDGNTGYDFQVTCAFTDAAANAARGRTRQ